MSHPDSRVIVTFVGGPLHGLQQELDAPPERFWRDLPNGSALLYSQRWCSRDADGAGAQQMPVRAVYSPVGMSEHAYRELLQTVDVELRETLAAFAQAPARQSRGTP